jgi:ADP-heptose:LPS heptosyltransferase
VSSFSRNVRRLQWLDRRIGVVVCWLLTRLRRLSEIFRADDRAGAWRSIVFVKLAEQGSTVLAAATLRAAAARVGREHVYLLVFEDNRFIVDVLDVIPPENVLTVQTRSPWTMAVSCWRRLAELRGKPIDACVDLEFFARSSAAISFLTGARWRSGFHTWFGEGPYRGDLMTHRVLYNPHIHTSAAFAALLAALDTDPRKAPLLDVTAEPLPPPTCFTYSAPERAAAIALLREAGVPVNARVILLNANCGDLLPLRRWPSAHYVELARRLLQEFEDATIVFTGSPEEEPATAELARAVGSPRSVCLAGRTSLRQLMIVYELAEILVTNDSGPAHFAALTRIDVVALFGPETPALFAAPGPRSHSLWAGIPCSPCVNAYNNRQTACRDNVCMQRLTVDFVFAKVGGIYRRRAASPA